MVEKRSFNLEVKTVLESEDNRRVVEGYASTWDLDTGKDKIIPGAFKSTINERFSVPMALNNKSKIKVLWQHDQHVLIGKLLEIKETEQGLYVKLELFNDPSFPEADRAYKLLKMGEIFCFSIGFKVKDAESMYVEDNEYIRLIKEVILYEVSLVTFPMNEKAEVTNVKEKNSSMNEQAVELLQEIKSLLQQMNEVKSEEIPAVEVVEVQPVEIVEVEAEAVKEIEQAEIAQEEKAKEKEDDKCPSCGQMKKEAAEVPEEKSTEVIVGDINLKELKTAVDQILTIKFLTIEDVKSVFSELMEQKNTEVIVIAEDNSVKEEKSKDSVEDFMSYLLNTKISF